MLLRRLVEYAETTDDVIPPFYNRKPVRFLLYLTGDGRPVSIEMTDTADPSVSGQRYGVNRLVPAVTRTVGIAPALAADTVEYVLGWVSDDGGNPDRVARQHLAFQELIRDWAAAEPDGPAPAIAAFYAAGRASGILKPARWSRADLVAFVVDGQVACEHESARRYWATVAAGRKGLGRAGRCLVCGEVRELLKTIPTQIPRRLLPGATNSASLVSINEAVHGYELQKFLGHTPICVTCGLTFMSSLTALLDSERHSSTLPGQNARLVWWLVGGSTFDVMESLDDPSLGDATALQTAPVDRAGTGRRRLLDLLLGDGERERRPGGGAGLGRDAAAPNQGEPSGLVRRPPDRRLVRTAGPRPPQSARPCNRTVAAWSGWCGGQLGAARRQG
jgi:CRISPR-associated protein (Cas_Csd1).